MYNMYNHSNLLGEVHFDTGKPAEFFSGCFIVASAEVRKPYLSWVTEYYRGWVIHRDARLPLVRITNAGGGCVGLLLGYAIETDLGQYVNETILETEGHEELNDNNVDILIERLGGRYLLLVTINGVDRIYGDASGSLAAVFSAKLNMVASRVELLDDGDLHCKELLEALTANVRTSQMIYPAGMTKLRHASLLLPNHYLDMDRFQSVRYYQYKIKITNSCRDDAIIAKKIVELVVKQVTAIASRHRVAMNITAGQDSRMLLAAARSHASDILFHTLSESNITDTVISKLISQCFGLNHVFLSRNDIVNRWTDLVHMPGLGGEMGRCYYWRDGDSERQLTPAVLRERVGYHTNHPHLDDVFANWASSLPRDQSTIIDMLYLEQRLGCCMSPAMYSKDRDFKFTIIPFNSRIIYNLMMNMSISYRLNSELLCMFCQVCWPDLALFPVNKCEFGILKTLRIRKTIYNSNLDQRSREAILQQLLYGKSFISWLFGKLCVKLYNIFSMPT